MNDHFKSDFSEVQGLVRERFPHIKCVRCESDRFLMRVWKEASLSPAFSDDRVVELICENCGFVEKHLVNGLKGALNEMKMPVSDDA